MRPNHHHLASDFPEHKERLAVLLASDAQFQHMNTEYELLDTRIYEVETQGLFMKDEDMDALKKKRALLKDQIYAVLSKS